MICVVCSVDKNTTEFRICDKTTGRRRKQCLECEHSYKNDLYQAKGANKPSGYNCWQSMIQRCTNPNNKDYKNYGARGIVVCIEWLTSFEAFIDHIGPRPSNKHSIDRINNADGYCPGNVRWATASEQSRNMRSNKLLTFNSQTKTLSEWAQQFGLHHETILHRLNIGWSVQRALTEPLGPSSKRNLPL